MTKSKKDKRTNPSHNLHSQNRMDANSNRDSPNHNTFDVFNTSDDDDTIHLTDRNKERIDTIGSSIEAMNASFTSKFDSILSLLSVHNRALADSGILPATPTTDPSTNKTVPPSAPVDTKVPIVPNDPPISDTEFKDYPSGIHDYSLLPTAPSIAPKVEQIPSPPSASPLAPSKSDTPLDPPKFGQNDFSVIVSGATKIKYMSMETYLKDKIIESDSVRDIEKCMLTSSCLLRSFSRWT